MSTKSIIIWISIGIVIGMTCFLCSRAFGQLPPITTPVTFINENPGVTQLGLVKFIIDENGEKADYKLMNIRWDYKLYVIDLEPGVYGVTQWAPKIGKVVGYQTFEVKYMPMFVRFRRL